MALVLKDRVRESSTTSGTGPLTLNGPLTGFQGFSVIGNSNTTYYAIVDATTGAWEVGIGTYTTAGQTLSRDTVLESSNGGALVNFTTNVKDVFCTYPAEQAVTLTDIQTLTNKTISTPTLTGSVTLDAGTANGVLYLNGSKVATSGSALTFDGTNLGVGVASPGQLIDGAAANPRLRLTATTTGHSTAQFVNSSGSSYFGRDNDTGSFFGIPNGTVVYSSTSNPIGFYLSGAEQMRLTSTGLGIGTSSPAVRLHAYSATSMAQLTVDGVGAIRTGVNFASGGTTYGQIYFDNTVPYDMSVMQQWSTGSLRFGTNSTERLRIDSAGNVGIGTSSPSQRLTVAGAGTAARIEVINTADANRGGYLRDTGTTFEIGTNSGVRPLAFAYDGTERMRIDSVGNVGIGTSSPTQRLHTYIAAGNVYNLIESGSAASVAVATGYKTANRTWEIGQSPGLGNNFFTIFDVTAGAVRVAIDTSGNLGVGTSSPSQRLSVQGADFVGSSFNGLCVTDGTERIRIGYRNGALNTGLVPAQIVTDVAELRIASRDTTAGTIIFHTGTGVPERLRIDSSGNLGIGTSSPGAKLTVSGTAGNGNGMMSVDGADFVRVYADTSFGSTINWSVGDALRFATSDSNFGSFTERARLDSSGNLGLGVVPSAWRTNTPAFQIGGSGVSLFSDSGVVADIGNNVFLNASSQYIYQRTDLASRYRQYQGIHSWYTAPSGTAGNAISFSQSMTLDASGNLLVGSTSSQGVGTHRLQVGSTGATAQFLLKSFDGHVALYSSGTNVYQSWASGGFLAFGHAPADGSSFTERARIDSSGNLLLGTTTNAFNGAGRGLIEMNGSSESLIALKRNNSAATSSYILHRSTDLRIVQTENAPMLFYTNDQERARIDSGGGLLVGCTSIPSATVVGCGINVSDGNGDICFSHSTGNTTNDRAFAFFNPNGMVGSITTNGSATTYSISSDARLKENIAPANDASSLIDAIQVRQFDWKADGAHQRYGMVAQELDTVYPEAVSKFDNPDATMGVDYSKLVPLLIKEVQALRARVAALESN
jgi:hypothetical protein